MKCIKHYVRSNSRLKIISEASLNFGKFKMPWPTATDDLHPVFSIKFLSQIQLLSGTLNKQVTVINTNSLFLIILRSELPRICAY